MIDFHTRVVIELKWVDRELGTIETTVGALMATLLLVGGVLATVARIALS